MLTHEDLDHVAANQLFPDVEIIAHGTVPGRMTRTADPSESQKLQHAIDDPATCAVLENAHPRVLAVASTGKLLPSCWTVRPSVLKYQERSEASV